MKTTPLLRKGNRAIYFERSVLLITIILYERRPYSKASVVDWHATLPDRQICRSIPFARRLTWKLTVCILYYVIIHFYYNIIINTRTVFCLRPCLLY
jgi:hypothetical protein